MKFGGGEFFLQEAFVSICHWNIWFFHRKILWLWYDMYSKLIISTKQKSRDYCNHTIVHMMVVEGNLLTLPWLSPYFCTHLSQWQTDLELDTCTLKWQVTIAFSETDNLNLPLERSIILSNLWIDVNIKFFSCDLNAEPLK